MLFSSVKKGRQCDTCFFSIACLAHLLDRSRPFGVALLVAGVDEYGPSLFHTDPSGTFVKYEAKAIGAGSEGAQTALQESYSSSMTLAEAEVLALSTLKQVIV